MVKLLNSYIVMEPECYMVKGTGGAVDPHLSAFVAINPHLSALLRGGEIIVNHERSTQQSRVARTEKGVGSPLLGFARLCSPFCGEVFAGEALRQQRPTGNEQFAVLAKKSGTEAKRGSASLFKDIEGGAQGYSRLSEMLLKANQAYFEKYFYEYEATQ